MAIAIPAVLGLVFLFAKLSGGHADRCLRLLRYVLVAEFLALLILCAAGYFYERHAEARDARQSPPPGRLIDIGGYRLHLNCIGDGGPTVVLEYGLEGSYLDWRRVQPEIARFARVCTYDRAGYGWSDATARPRVPSVMADELHSLLRAAGEEPPYILVGHSYGSLIVQMFAHKFLGETAGLVLLDGMHPGPSASFPLRHRLWLRFLQWTAPFGLPRWRGWCAPPASANCRARVFATYYREWSRLSESGAAMRAVTNLGAVPLIVISRDPALGHNPEEERGHIEEQRNSLNLSSNAQLIIAEGSGHDIPGTRPDLVVQAVKRLLKPPAPVDSRETP